MAAIGAMFFEPSPVRAAACSGGSVKIPASTVMIPPVTIAPSHSRTYRSSSPARPARSAAPPGPAAAAVNSPVRCPMSIK